MTNFILGCDPLNSSEREGGRSHPILKAQCEIKTTAVQVVWFRPLTLFWGVTQKSSLVLYHMPRIKIFELTKSYSDTLQKALGMTACPKTLPKKESPFRSHNFSNSFRTIKCPHICRHWSVSNNRNISSHLFARFLLGQLGRSPHVLIAQSY